MKTRLLLFLAVLLLSGISTSAAHGSIAILNPSFELDMLSPAGPLLAFTTRAPTDWMGDSGGVLGVLTTDPSVPGNFSSELSPAPGNAGYQDAWDNGGPIYQVLSTGLVTGQAYVLTADIGLRSYTFATYPWPGTSLNLGYGTVPGMHLLNATSVTDPTPAPGSWASWQTTFVAGATGAGDPLRIDLVSNGIQVQFDNITLSAVPEPASLAIWGVVIAGGLLVARRRKA